MMSYAVHRLVAQAGPLSDHPDPVLPKRPTRRRFDRAYKISILAEWDRCSEHGEKAALLRREGLYSSRRWSGTTKLDGLTVKVTTSSDSDIALRACSEPWALPEVPPNTP